MYQHISSYRFSEARKKEWTSCFERWLSACAGVVWSACWRHASCLSVSLIFHSVLQKRVLPPPATACRPGGPSINGSSQAHPRHPPHRAYPAASHLLLGQILM